MMNKLEERKPKRAYQPRGPLKVRGGLQSVTLYLEPEIKLAAVKMASVNGRTVGYHLADLLTRAIRRVSKK